MSTTPQPDSPTPSRYRWTHKGVTFDFYRLCEILGITHHAQAHALKKVIRAGRGDKPLGQDIDEAIDSLRRWKEMNEEDGGARKIKFREQMERCIIPNAPPRIYAPRTDMALQQKGAGRKVVYRTIPDGHEIRRAGDSLELWDGGQPVRRWTPARLKSIRPPNSANRNKRPVAVMVIYANTVEEYGNNGKGKESFASASTP